MRERDAKTSFCSFVPYVTFCNHIVILLDKVTVELCNLSNYVYDGCLFTYDLFYMNCYGTVRRLHPLKIPPSWFGGVTDWYQSY